MMWTTSRFMRRERVCLLSAGCVIAILAGCATKPLERQIVDDAASALGGQDRILAVKTIVIEGEGTNANLGQDMTMDSSGEQFMLSGYRRAIDVANSRTRTEQTRTPNFAYFQGQQPQKQVFGVDGGVAYNIAPDGAAVRAPDAVARDRRLEFYHHPITITRLALDPSTQLTNPRTIGSERVVDLATPGGLKFTLAADANTHLPTRVVSMTDNTNLGDVAIETSFADYEDVGGLKLPRRVATKTDKYATAEVRATRQRVDADAGDLAAPVAASSAAAITGPPPANVTTEEVAKGVWFLAGQSHHSVVIEFADHLTLIETPQNDTRSLAVIAKARTLRPDKPLTEVVNTHHHFDHSGGIRAAISEGLTVITQKANVAFFQEAATRAHTIVPDALARNPKPAKIVPVDEEMVLQDATRRVELYHIAGNPHADTLLMAYLPKERVLVEVDAFSPGAAVQPYAANLRENISRRKLRIDRIVPLHGTIVPFAELVKAQ
jgi:glyoxylase-like metal-dependent hydrolase (beta-lactamase superfamily II)